jgi:hypothetical protein
MANPLEVKNVVGDYLAIENWEKVKTRTFNCKKIQIH